jgi:histidine phosphotransferase ChpT
MEKQLIDSTVLELMASRVCHDLISPVGAVNNGVEFLQDDIGGDQTDAIQLISMSAQSAAARLQVFRYAYGSGGRDASIKPEDIHKTFDGFLLAEEKVKQNWDPFTTFADYDRPEGFSKMLMCTLMLTHEALPKGGVITVSHTNGTTTVTGTGTDAGLRPQVDQALSRKLDVSVIDPRLVHPYVCGIMAAQYGFSLTIGDKVDGSVSFLFAGP